MAMQCSCQSAPAAFPGSPQYSSALSSRSSASTGTIGASAGSTPAAHSQISARPLSRPQPPDSHPGGSRADPFHSPPQISTSPSHATAEIHPNQSRSTRPRGRPLPPHPVALAGVPQDAPCPLHRVEQQARDNARAVLQWLVAKDTRIYKRPRWHLFYALIDRLFRLMDDNHRADREFSRRHAAILMTGDGAGI